MVKYKELAVDFVNATQDLRLRRVVGGDDMVFEVNGALLQLPKDPNEAQNVINLCKFWDHYVLEITQKFEQAILNFCRDNKVNFN